MLCVTLHCMSHLNAAPQINKWPEVFIARALTNKVLFFNVTCRSASGRNHWKGSGCVLVMCTRVKGKNHSRHLFQIHISKASLQLLKTWDFILGDERKEALNVVSPGASPKDKPFLQYIWLPSKKYVKSGPSYPIPKLFISYHFLVKSLVWFFFIEIVHLVACDAKSL